MMRKLINVVLMVILFILILLILGLLLAINVSHVRVGNADAPRSAPNIDLSSSDVPKLVEALKIWKLIDDLELEKVGDDKMVAFLAKYKQLEKLRYEYHKAKGGAMGNLKGLIESSASDSEIKVALENIKRIDSEFFQEDVKLLKQLNANLSPNQQARFIIFQDSYWRDMRKLTRNLRELSELRENKPPQ